MKKSSNKLNSFYLSLLLMGSVVCSFPTETRAFEQDTTVTQNDDFDKDRDSEEETTKVEKTPTPTVQPSVVPTPQESDEPDEIEESPEPVNSSAVQPSVVPAPQESDRPSDDENLVTPTPKESSYKTESVKVVPSQQDNDKSEVSNPEPTPKPVKPITKKTNNLNPLKADGTKAKVETPYNVNSAQAAAVSEGVIFNKLLATQSRKSSEGWFAKKGEWYKLADKTEKRFMIPNALKGLRYSCIAEGEDAYSDVDILAYNHYGLLLDSDTNTSTKGQVMFDKTLNGNVYIDVKMYNKKKSGGFFYLWCGFKDPKNK